MAIELKHARNRHGFRVEWSLEFGGTYRLSMDYGTTDLVYEIRREDETGFKTRLVDQPERFGVTRPLLTDDEFMQVAEAFTRGL